MKFRSIALTTAVANRFRLSGLDDGSNVLRPIVATTDTGFFCRHCLDQAGKGTRVLLGSYHVERPRGHFWSPSPIFIHADTCERFQGWNEIPEAIRKMSLVGLRPYDAEHRLLYHLNDVVAGSEVDAFLERCLSDARTSYVNIHTGRPGCFLCQIERA